MLHAFASPICALKCCRQQSSQKVWPQSMVVVMSASTSEQQISHVTRSVMWQGQGGRGGALKMQMLLAASAGRFAARLQGDEVS